ncbi:MAG: pyrroloquinoline quinone biosynthesis peptide chaperone PqqD [Gammaproteobacteria bacterium]|nr:pyrroloquinoline quinone biosynthesis peptide chaperone PqqD [Gammaproteobacteria bacterium]
MSVKFSAQDIPALSPGFRLQWEQAQDCFVILYPEGMVKLNLAAGEILKRCDGTTPVGDIIDNLKIQFPDTNLDEDVYTFLSVAHDKQWIQRHSA